MSSPFFYVQKSQIGFSINLTNFSGETVLIGKSVDSKYDFNKCLQALKTHLCFNSNYCRTRSADGYYSFEIRTCWDELIAQSILFESRDSRESTMHEVFSANKVAHLRDIALQPYITGRVFSIAS